MNWLIAIRSFVSNIKERKEADLKKGYVWGE